jgi:hypothetical protein
MKWFEKIAQGFNPGSANRVRCPERATRCGAVLAGQNATNSRTPIGRHFQGVPSLAVTQGLSPGLFCTTISWSRAPILTGPVSSQINPEESPNSIN